MKPATRTTRTAVPIRKNLPRTRVRNSRRRIRRTVWSASRPRPPISGRSRGDVLGHRLPKDVEQTWLVGPELLHGAGGQCGSKDRLVVGGCIELDEDPGAVRSHHAHTAKGTDPALRPVGRAH